MGNTWIVVMYSKEQGKQIYQYDTPQAQIKGTVDLLKMAQKHRAVDNISRAVFAIPDPCRNDQTVENFVSMYF